METSAKLTLLAKVSRTLDAAEITWAVGASAMLYLEGAADHFEDFDLMIASEHTGLARDVMLALGADEAPAVPPSTTYATQWFGEFCLNGVDFDLLSGFAVRRHEEVYRYPFSAEHAQRRLKAKSNKVPVTPLADWYVLYQLMPGRGDKAALVANHMKANPSPEHCHWLDLWLADRLPGDVRTQVFKLYSELQAMLV